MDPAGQAGVAFLVTVSRLLLGIFSRCLGIAGGRGVLDLARATSASVRRTMS